MRKVLWFAIFCAMFTVSVNAQSESLVKAYANWKNVASQNMTEQSVHYGLAISSKRMSANSAVMGFMSVGKIGKLTLKITPVAVERDKNGKIVNEIEGETATANQPVDDSKTAASSQLSIALPVTNTSNAIRIVWDFVGNGEKMSSTILVPLEKEDSVNFVGILTKDSAIPLCPGCIVVSGSNERCGFFYKCCLNYVGNSIDFTTCSVT